MNKQVVQYREILSPASIVVGSHVVLIPVDHPSPRVVNGEPCCTTEVVSHDETTGQFETKNTLYVPEGSLSAGVDA